MSNLEEYGLDDTHCVKIESVKQYELMASYLRERGIDYFTLTTENCLEYPYAYIDGGLHGCRDDESDDGFISFEEWAANRGLDPQVSVNLDVCVLNSLL